MQQRITPGICPHCGRGPGLREARAAIDAVLARLPLAQVVDGWRYLALTHYIAALLLVERGLPVRGPLAPCPVSAMTA